MQTNIFRAYKCNNKLHLQCVDRHRERESEREQESESQRVSDCERVSASAN